MIGLIFGDSTETGAGTVGTDEEPPPDDVEEVPPDGAETIPRCDPCMPRRA